MRERATQAATERARAEGRIQLKAARSTAWQRAVDQAKQPDLGKPVQPRPLALIIGLGWLFLAARRRWRVRRRASARA
ncbi:MAG: hypothetical protein H7287_07890 [Thermoleophilia bacterium]|nr:hypothetical protein [Thermoleophilia bacterium]